MAFLDSVSRFIAGLVSIFFLFVLLPYMYGAMSRSVMFSDPVLSVAGIFMLVVFIIAVVYVAFFKKEGQRFPKGLIEV
jgi:hypothetical protein